MSDDEFEFLGLDKKELLGVGNLAGHYANNQKLKDIQGRGPACPHCRGNLADSGVKVCMHCGRDVVWDYGRALTPAEARELIEARKTAEKQVYFLFRSIGPEPTTWTEANGFKYRRQIDETFDAAIAIRELVLDSDGAATLTKEKAARLRPVNLILDKLKQEEQKKLESKYGKAHLEKELMVEGLTVVPLLLGVCYGLYAISCWLLSLMNFEPWFWNIIPSWLHYSLIFGCPILTVIVSRSFSHWKKRTRSAIVQGRTGDYSNQKQQKTIESAKKKESKSESDNQKKAKKPTKKEDAQTQPVAYYLKRGETIRGPLERAAILQAATGKKLLSGDQIANTKAGPWQDITKEQLQEMQQGSDVKIK